MLTKAILFATVISMRRVDLLWFTLISEVLVNLSAGWLGIALATMLASDKSIVVKFGLLTGNLGLGIVSLIAAFKLRKRGKK